jgi:hypothetical protein
VKQTEIGGKICPQPCNALTNFQQQCSALNEGMSITPRYSGGED